MHFITRNQTTITTIILMMLLLLPVITFAEGPGLIESTLWSLVVATFGKFMGFGGALLDHAIANYVVGFGNQYTQSGVGAVVDLLWVTVRDLFNITFIFGLLYIGFKMILNSDDSNTRRWLINLIIAALLVNFSLFFTKAVVDLSNMFASQIAMNGFQLKSSGDLAGYPDVSTTFMNSLGMQSIIGASAPPLPSDSGGGNMYGYIFGSMILFIVATFVFAAGAIILMIRFVSLLLYMVLSPFMFIGWVLPQLQQYTSRYWSGFLGRAFFAPIYLLLVYFSARVISAFYANIRPNFQGMLTGGGDAVELNFGSSLPPFILSCIFLIAALVIASKLSADGSSAALSMGRSMANRAKNSVQRSTVWTARKGAAIATAAPREGVRRGSYALGRGLENQLNQMQASNGRVGKISAALLKTNAVDRSIRGASAKMRDAKVGFATTVEQDRAYKNQTTDRAGLAQKRDQSAAQLAQGRNEEEAGNIKEGRNQQQEAINSMAGVVPRMDDTTLKNMTNKELMSDQVAANLTDAQVKMLKDSGRMSGAENDELKTRRNEATFKHTEAILDDASSSAEELTSALEELAKTVRNMSDDRLQGMRADKAGEGLLNERVAANLTETQLGNLEKSGKYNPDQMQQIRSTREAALNKTITNGSIVDSAQNPNAQDATFQRTQRERVLQGSTKEVGSLPVSVFVNATATRETVQSISPQALEERIKNGSISNEDKAAIEKNITAFLNDSSTSAADKKKWLKWSENTTIGSSFDFKQSGRQDDTNPPVA